MKVCRKIKSRGNIRIFLCRHLHFCKASRKQPTGLGIIKVRVLPPTRLQRPPAMDSLHAWRTAFHLLYLPGDGSPLRLLGKNLPCCWLSSGAGGRWSLVGGSTRTLMIPKPVGCFLEALQNWRCRQRKIRMLPRDFILRQTFMIFIHATIKIKKQRNWRRSTSRQKKKKSDRSRPAWEDTQNNWRMWELGVSVTAWKKILP